MGNQAASSYADQVPVVPDTNIAVCLMVEPSPFTYVSGYATRFQQMLRYLDEQGDRVEIITTDQISSTKPDRYLRFPVHHTWGLVLPWYRELSLSIDVRFKGFRVIHRLKPDILHVSSPGWMVFPAIFYSRLLGVPLVFSFHTHLPVYVRQYLPNFRLAEGIVWWLIQICHGFADLTLVTSSQIQQEFVSRRIPRVDVWRKGIDTELFHPRYKDAEARSIMTAGNPDEFLIVYVGRLAAEKRVMDLKGILDASPTNTRLCFVGTGPLEEQLKQIFAGKNVVFTGQLRGEELSKAYASADVMVFPSDSETLGFVVLEAMASGTPVVAARAGGIPDMIDDGMTSFLVSTGDISEYVKKINLLREDAFRSEMGRLAREEAEKWNWDSSMSHLRNVQYQKAMKNYQRRFGVRVVNWFRWSEKQVKQQ